MAPASAKDAKDCHEPACSSRTEAYKAMMAAAAAKEGKKAVQCPPDRDELGRHSWTLLHTMAAYYPDKPSEAERRAALQLVNALPHLYPCRDCAHDLGEHVRESPPQVGSRADFSLWMCELHNHVNEAVGKPTFKCELKALDEAWRTGSKACQEAGGGAHGGQGALGH